MHKFAVDCLVEVSVDSDYMHLCMVSGFNPAVWPFFLINVNIIIYQDAKLQIFNLCCFVTFPIEIIRQEKFFMRSLLDVRKTLIWT